MGPQKGQKDFGPRKNFASKEFLVKNDLRSKNVWAPINLGYFFSPKFLGQKRNMA